MKKHKPSLIGRPQILISLALGVASLLVTWWAFVVFIIDPGLDAYERARYVDMVYGKAYKPFVYRALLPVTIRTLTHLVPEERKQALTHFIQDNYWKSWAKERWQVTYATEYLIGFAFMYLALVGFLWAVAKLFQTFYQAAFWVPWLGAILAVAILPAQFKYLSYLYDFPNLFFFTTGLLLLARQAWRPFLLLYPLACLNKETTILLTVVFALVYFPVGSNQAAPLAKRQFWLLLLYQIIVFGLIKAGLSYWFMDNPGQFVEFHWKDHNLALFLKPPEMTWVVASGIVLLLIFHNWQEKPIFLRKALWISVPLLGLTLALGYLDELRDYYEVYPILFTLGYTSVLQVVGIKYQCITW